MKGLTRLAKLVHVVSGESFDFHLADGELSTRIEKAGLLHLHAFKPLLAQRAGQNGGAWKNDLIEIFQAEVVEVLVAEQNDVGFITARHFKRVGVDDFRSLDFEGVMSDASKFEVQKFHHTPPSELSVARRDRSGHASLA